jgi:translation initiation factor IF-2
VQRLKRQPRRRVTLENLYESIERGQSKQLDVVLKADVQGSLEPLLASMGRLGNAEVSVRVIHTGIGSVSTSDVLLADASDAIIIAFRVGVDERVREMAAERGVEIVHFDVIYHMTDQIHKALEGMLEPEVQEQRLGLAEVRRIFRISRYGVIAGCYVAEGIMRRNARVRVFRDGQLLHEGAIAGLKQVKSDVREVEASHECGINVEGFNNIQPGDTIECFTTVTAKRSLPAEPARAIPESPS